VFWIELLNALLLLFIKLLLYCVDYTLIVLSSLHRCLLLSCELAAEGIAATILQLLALDGLLDSCVSVG